MYGVAARAAVAVLRRLPYPVLRGFFRVTVAPVARLMFANAAEKNLITAFGDALTPQARRKILAQMFRNMAAIPAEMLSIVQRGQPFLDRLFAGDTAVERWRKAHRECGGIVALSGHVGNWEAFLQWLHVHGERPFGGAVAKRIPNPRLNRLVEDLRGCLGVKTLYGDSGVMKLARVVADGLVLGIVPDQDIERVGGTFVEFFGRPAYTPTGPARLALATGAPLLVVLCRRVGDRLEAVINDPIYPDRKAPREAEIVRLTRAWSAQIEEFIRAHPEQWLWFHDRWATTEDTLAARSVSGTRASETVDEADPA